MRRMMIIPALLLAGCSNPGGGGGDVPKVVIPKVVIPKIDASSDKALKDSLERIEATLSETAKKEFAADCSLLTANERMKFVHSRALGRTDGKPPGQARFYKKLHGATAARVHDWALTQQADNERLNAEAKAEKIKSDTIALAKDPEAVKNRAVEAMREAATEQIGKSEARLATITAELSDVKDVGELAWEVTGFYGGEDREGKRFKATWTARVELSDGTLRCPSGAKLGARKPVGLDSASTNAPAVANNELAAAIAAANLSVPPANVSPRPGPAANLSVPPAPSAKAAPRPGPAPGTPAKPTPKPRAKAKSKPEMAAEALKRGKIQLEAGQREEAFTTFREIVDNYRDTPSYKEAKERFDVLLGKPKPK